MSQIQREGEVRFGDASLSVWENPERRGWDQWQEYERDFKRQVFKRIVQQLNRLGWSVQVPSEMIEQYGRSFAEGHRYCRKGDLQGYLDLSGRCIKFEMWQDVANGDNPNGGRYDFDKEKRMPYLLWLETERTRLRVRDYLCNVFSGYGFCDRKGEGRHAKRGPGGLTAVEWVEQSNRSGGHYDSALGRARINMASNARSADGETINHGAQVFAIGYDDRVVVGTAYYNLNNMWWVVTGKYGLLNVHSGAIYLTNPGDLRRKRNDGKRRSRLERELSRAVKAMDFQRAQVIKDILFPTNEPLFMVYHKEHGCYHRSNFCGYARDLVDAGRFTWEELGRFRPRNGGMEDDLSRIVPVDQEVKAA
ncbi:hypothetical protein BKP64_10745 [Marinobacter salinus]|uniref:UVR domain-containing protein n=1 Tax=Marinobacter salinus TaxID=1874317 RepID=A0A1D9GLT9_9GAMM|nr:hypothetical protein [Marinobacter salinus]AOY88606.1 hypothetical protein BKP64_10745 [Marinobacter salinus]